MKEKLVRILYPRVCPVCGEILSLSPPAANPYICSGCYSKLKATAGALCCVKCGKVLKEDEEYLCDVCKKRTRYFDEGRSLLLHNDEAKKILYDLKYSDLRDNVDFAGKELASVFAPWVAARRISAVIPVPLHAKRRRERGFNQAELVAARFIREMKEAGLAPPLLDTEYLKRTGETVPLKELTAAKRTSAVKGAFAVVGKEEQYESVLLIDDIFTTGATLNECAKVLKEAGTARVYFLTVSSV